MHHGPRVQKGRSTGFLNGNERPYNRPMAPRATDADLEHWYAIRDQVKARDRDDEPEELAPADAFPDTTGSRQRRQQLQHPAPEDRTGPNSAALERRIGKSCAGWEQAPTGPELFEALRAPHPTDRQKTLVALWVLEPDMYEVIEAWMEGAYTLKGLAAAMHRTGNAGIHPRRNRELNRFARHR